MHKAVRPHGWTFVDLFSGCGGLALGFEQAGFKSVYAVDIEPTATQTYKANFGHDVFCGDIADVKKLPAAEFFVGGPPCQGFSPLGKMSPGSERRQDQVKLNKLWREYLRLVDQVAPIGFVVENVPEILTSAEFPILEKEIKKRGYNYVYGILNAHDYGVPQRRRRAVIIALRGHQPQLPTPVPAEKRTDVRWALTFPCPLSLKPDGENWHVGRNPQPKSVERYKCVPPGGNRFDLMEKRPDITPDCWMNKPTGSTDVFGRLEWDQPSLTIRTEFYKPEKGRYLHPKAHRPITHREAARLQTFPDSFNFVGSKVEVARMIGNAVPPTLAYHIALAIRKSIENSPLSHLVVVNA